MDEKTNIIIDAEANHKWPKNLPKDDKNPELAVMLKSKDHAK